MGDAAVVTDEDSILEDRCEMRQRQIFRERTVALSVHNPLQVRDLFFIGFATNNDELLRSPRASNCSPSSIQFSIGQFFVSLPLPG